MTLSIIPPWTLAETERLREEFGATLDTDDVDDLSETISELEAIFFTDHWFNDRILSGFGVPESVRHDVLTK